jgi:hypothetical protein
MDQTTSPLLGRCKECDYALFATRSDVTNVEDFKNVRTAGVAYRVGNNGYFGRCDKGHRFFVLKAIKGTYSPDHQCDSRCLNARGHTCTCSCGGANHGRGHAVTTHVATVAVEPTFSTVLQVAVNPRDTVSIPSASAHIGEVGKHIRGTAKVIAVRDVNDATLYTFATEGGSIIKWFCPSYANPEYAVGQTVTFRAKVKKHDEWNGEAQTVVTYLEEVE